MSCQRLLIVLTMLIFLIFTLGLGVQKADAGACKRIGRPNGCVTAADVKNDNLKAADLKDEAGADYSSGDQSLALTSVAQVVRSVTITAPRSGVVIVNASGYFVFDAGSYKTGSCSITTGSGLDSSHYLAASEDGYGALPFAATRGFTVDRGSATFNLVCRESEDGVSVWDTSMTAIYFPTRY